MRDRIFEWHRQNPNREATATLVHTVEPRLLCAPSSSSITAAPVQTTYQLTSNDCIAVLEAELFNLRARRKGADQGQRTRAQKARGVTIEDKEDEADVAAACAQLRTPRIEEVDEPRTPHSQTQVAQEAPAPAHAPEHPFRNIKDTAYTLPGTKNVGAQDKTPAAPYKHADPAYRTLPPIHDSAITTSVFQRSMEAPITITQ